MDMHGERVDHAGEASTGQKLWLWMSTHWETFLAAFVLVFCWASGNTLLWAIVGLVETADKYVSLADSFGLGANPLRAVFFLGLNMVVASFFLVKLAHGHFKRKQTEREHELNRELSQFREKYYEAEEKLRKENRLILEANNDKDKLENQKLALTVRQQELDQREERLNELSREMRGTDGGLPRIARPEVRSKSRGKEKPTHRVTPSRYPGGMQLQPPDEQTDES